MDTLFAKEKLLAQDRTIEWFFSWIMLGWAVTLALPGDTLTLPSFKGFLHHGLTEALWAGFFGVVGAGRMAALFINGRDPRTPRVRQFCAFLGFFSWLQIVTLFVQNKYASDLPWTPQIAFFAICAAFELLCLRRAAFDVRYSNR